MKKKLIIIVLVIILLSGSYISYRLLKKDPQATDTERFKKEYESLNNQINPTNNLTYPKVIIDELTPIKYASTDEALSLLKNGTGIIYFGFASCPWCRTAIPVFFNAVFNSNIDEVLYVDIEQMRSKIVVQNGKAVTEKKGTTEYYQIIKALDKNLDEYTGLDENNQVIDFGEKRLFAPTFVFVIDGKVIGIHVSTVKSQVNAYEALTSEQEQELYDIYNSYISQISNTSCGSDIQEEC